MTAFLAGFRKRPKRSRHLYSLRVRIEQEAKLLRFDAGLLLGLWGMWRQPAAVMVRP
jgi:hypothetical protein